MFEIKNHKLVGVEQANGTVSPHSFDPDYLMFHDTAGRLNYRTTVNGMVDGGQVESYHVIVGRKKGEIIQLVPFNKRANHAGESSYKGRTYCNGFSFGVSFANPGQMEKTSAGTWKPWFNKTYSGHDYSIAERATPQREAAGYNHPKFGWMAYTEWQIDAAMALWHALRTEYKLRDCITHWMVAPKRKVDTNPLFPLSLVRSASKDDLTEHTVTVWANELNVRQGPGHYLPQVNGSPYKKGDVLTVLNYDPAGSDWIHVERNGVDGWVNSNYTY